MKLADIACACTCPTSFYQLLTIDSLHIKRRDGVFGRREHLEQLACFDALYARPFPDQHGLRSEEMAKVLHAHKEPTRKSSGRSVIEAKDA